MLLGVIALMPPWRWNQGADGAISGLPGSRVLVTPEVTLFKEFLNEKKTHELYGGAVRLILLSSGSSDSERMSLELSHTFGEDAPEFIKQKVTTLALAVKF